MKNLTITQLADKFNNAKSNSTKDKVANFVLDNFGFEDCAAFYNMHKSDFNNVGGSDSMVR